MSANLFASRAAVIVLLAVLCVSPAGAQWYWPPDMSVIPAEPAPTDPITIGMSGEWPDVCVPNGAAVQPPTGNEVYFDLTWEYPPGTFCAAIISWWAEAASLPPQPAGTYGVYATLYDLLGLPMLGPTYVGAFEVCGPTLPGDTNCDGVVDFGDINPFVMALSDPAHYIETYPGCPLTSADIEGDGTVDFGDINPFVALLGAVAPYVAEYWNSGCQRASEERAIVCEEDDEIVLTVTGSTLDLVHYDAEYNCCPGDLVVSLTIEGDVLHFWEEELAQDCLCVCCYDIGATVLNLAPGAYTVEYCWYDYGSDTVLCDVQVIEVE